MGRRTLLAGMILFVFTGIAFTGQPPIKTVEPDHIPSFIGYVPGELVVQFKLPSDQIETARKSGGDLSLGIPSLDKIADKYNVTIGRQLFKGAKPVTLKGNYFDLSRYYLLRFDPAADLDVVLEEFRKNPNVESVEKNAIHSIYATPNDGYFSYQWYHNQTSDHDIDSPEAWDIETGSTGIIVAILDSGTRYFHPDLGGVNASYSNPGASRGNMWINTAELNGSSGYDDDGNGYVDDWIGWDFIDGVSNCWSGEDCNTEDNDPRDFNGHGTHTAGIVGMITNDGYGMAGVAGGWNSGSQTVYGNGVKIMALRMGYSYNYLGQEYGVVDMAAAASAFYYAADNGADIASCSWGSSNSGGLGAAVSYFISSGGLVFVAAGNDGDQSADYLNARGDCISVAATDENDNGASFTNYGTWVDICAPGTNIYSTFHDHSDPSTNYWASMGGTSMACPMAAGVGALIWSHNPGWTASQVETQLYNSVENIDAYLSSKYIGKMGAGRINAYDAVNTGGPAAPVADFSGSPTSGTAPLTVFFSDLSTGDITSWSWDFGDGVGTSTAQNPSYRYDNAGTYTVSLTVTGPGGSDTETKPDYITVTAPTSYANLPYSTGFESGSFDQYWTTAEGVEGRILITSGNGPHSGSYHMTMDDDYSGGSYSQNEAWLHVNLAGKTNVDLKFWWKEWSDETHTQDGIYFSDDGGSSFTKVFDLSGANTTWRQQTLDVDALAAANGLSLTGTFVIKFQQYDNYPITSDGMAFDDISVTEVSGGTGYAALPYSTGFESGDVDEFWTLIEGVEGWVGVTSSYTPHTGSYHLIMDDIVSGGSYSLNEAWLKVDLSGYANVDLSFWWKEYNDETHTQDGVYFSDNGGSSFTKVYSLSGGSTTYQQINLDVDNLCSTYGLSLTGTFVIKFQQYDNYPISSDGFCFDDISVTGSGTSSTGGPLVLQSQMVPTEFDLSQNYPNPFNPATNIGYAVPHEAHVTLEVFNILGQRVTTLVDEVQGTGFHYVEWNGNDHLGQSVASGIYIYRFTADDFVETRQMILMK